MFGYDGGQHGNAHVYIKFKVSITVCFRCGPLSAESGSDGSTGSNPVMPAARAARRAEV